VVSGPSEQRAQTSSTTSGSDAGTVTTTTTTTLRTVVTTNSDADAGGGPRRGGSGGAIHVFDSNGRANSPSGGRSRPRFDDGGGDGDIASGGAREVSTSEGKSGRFHSATTPTSTVSPISIPTSDSSPTEFHGTSDRSGKATSVSGDGTSTVRRVLLTSELGKERDVLSGSSPATDGSARAHPTLPCSEGKSEEADKPPPPPLYLLPVARPSVFGSAAPMFSGSRAQPSAS